MATLAPCLVTLRAEFNALNPDRDKASDGWIGDADHQENPTSDHNPDSNGVVHAIDVDETGPWPNGGTMEKFCQHLVTECRKSGESGKDKGRLKYIIYERRIWEASNGWAVREYTGSNAHDKHMHVSCEYASEYENDTSPWGIEQEWGDDMPTVDEIWNKKFEDPYQPGRMVAAKDWLRYVPSDADVKNVSKKVEEETAKILTAVDAVPTAAENAAAIAAIDINALADAIVAKLPPTTLTKADIEQCVKNVLLNGAA